MRIQESSLQMQASHEASRTQQVELTVERTLQPAFRQIFTQLATPAESAAATEASARQRVEQMLQSLVDAILAAIDGKKCADTAKLADRESGSCAAAQSGGLGADQAVTPAKGGVLRWQSTWLESIHESESTQLCGRGNVRCADGRVLDFDFSFSQSREFARTTLFQESGQVELRDPLLLTFDGQAAELSATRIDFDLDADGRVERMPGPGKGNGFLVFDRNGNGRADDGSELFGVRSGNGFADLATLDGDANGWIDEGDADFSRLRMWTVDGFKTLAESGIGALATASVAAPFALKTENNELLGQIRAAGVYLTEAGEAGRMLQVDLAVEPVLAHASDRLPTAGHDEPDQGQQLTDQ